MITKCRAWDKKDGKMRRVVSIEYNDNGSIKGVNVNITGPGHKRFLPFNDIVLLPYTDCVDQFGVPIYDGDIVKFEIAHFYWFSKNGQYHFIPYTSVIEFSSGCSWIMRDSDTVSVLALECVRAEQGTAKLTVIGNIFENPDLLPDYLKGVHVES